MIRLIAVFLTAVVATACCGGPGWAAAPAIARFSSAGGHARNKSGPEDLMYVVEPGDTITFSVQATGAETYRWEVNKSVQAETGPSLVWSVPKEEGIWEIHVTAVGPGGQAHHEWGLSTVSAAEAPGVFDYFADGRCRGREQTDPWGRPLPEWYVVSDLAPPVVSDRYLRPPLVGPPDDEGNVNATLYLPSDIAFGTWKFRYLLPGERYDGQGGWTHLRFCFVNPKDPTLPPFWYTRSMDSHNYTGLGHLNRIDHDVGWSPPRKLWQEVTIIRTRDGDLFTWVDGVFQFRGRELRGQEAASLSIKLAHYRPDRNPEGTICCDMVEVYRDRYLFPSTSVHYGQYIHDWRWCRREPLELERWFDFSATPTLFRVPPRPVRITLTRERLERHPKNTVYLPVLKRGIVIEGRAVRLSDIARSIRDRNLFRYDRASTTAVCGTNLVISEGSELVLEGQTLKFDCRKDGEHEFAVMFGATLRARNSTITTTGESRFNWRFASITHFGYHAGPIHNPRYTGPSYVSDLWYHGLCSLFLDGTTIDNCGYLFLSSPIQLEITNCKFSNLHAVDTAEYERLFGRPNYPAGAAKGIKNRFKGNKGFWIGLFGPQMLGFNFRNVHIAGKRSPINFTFSGNDMDYQNLNLYDVAAPSENIVIQDGFRIAGYRKPESCDSTLGLVNSRFRQIIVPTDRARAVVKYYLRVDVVDRNGKPVEGAGVKIRNEVDDGNFPAEREEDVWIVADYVQSSRGKREFTYAIEAVAPDGRRGRVVGVDPSAAWYRPDGRRNPISVKVVVK